MGASWVAILVEEDPQWRGIRTLLVEAEVERGRGRGGKRGAGYRRGWGREERGGGGAELLKIDNIEGTSWQFSPKAKRS